MTKGLLFVVADGEHVRFVRPAGDNALHSETRMDSEAAHKRSSDLGSDRPGAMVPRHDPQDLEKAKFARAIAEQLNAGSAEGVFDELVIVAPSHTLAAVRDALNTITAAKVVGTLAKDLVKVPDNELWPHVREWVRPAHRAVSSSVDLS